MAVNTVLVALIAYVATELVLQYLSPQEEREPAIETPIGPTQIPTKPGRAKMYRQISDWHLFGEAVNTPQALKAPVNAPETKLNLTLRGIVSSDIPDASLAIIQNNDQKTEQHFLVGASVFGLATLEKIHVDRVILQRNGRYETLRLPEERLALPASRSADHHQTRRPRTAQEHVQFMKDQMKDIHKMTLEEMRNPWQYLYLEPAMENGRIVGLKLTAEEEREFLNEHGLELGDIITSINGNRLDGGGGVAKAMRAFTGDGTLEMTVHRSGKTVSVHVSREDQ